MFKQTTIVINLNAEQVAVLLGNNVPQNTNEEYKMVLSNDGASCIEVSYHDQEFDINVVEEYTPVDGGYQKTRELHFHGDDETGVDVMAE